MKTLIASALALTMASSAFAGACESIPSVSRFNPTELSERQICFVNEYRADDQHGVLGSLFWVRVNDRIYSTQISRIATASDVKQAISDWLNDEVVVDIQSDIDAFNTIVESSNEIIVSSTDIELAETKAELVEALSAKMEAEESLEKALADLDVSYADIADLKTSLAAAEAEIATIGEQVANAKKEGRIAVRERLYTIAQSDYGLNLKGTISNAVTKDELRTAISAIVAEAKVGYHSIDAVNAMNASTKTNLDEAFGTYDEETLNDSVNAVITNLALAKDMAAYTSVLTKGASKGDVDYYNDSYADGTLDFHKDLEVDYGTVDLTSLSLTAETLKSIADQIEDVAQAAYNDGYEDGYADGYSDGFKAGVDSVTE